MATIKITNGLIDPFDLVMIGYMTSNGRTVQTTALMIAAIDIPMMIRVSLLQIDAANTPH